MKKVTFFRNCEVRQLIGLVALLTLFGFSPSAFSVTFDMDAFVCTGGVGTNGISVTDVTGNPDGATECFGVFGAGDLLPGDGNDPGPGGSLIAGGMIFDFVAKYNVDTDLLEGMNIGLIVTGDPDLPDSSGSWSYDSNLFTADAFMIVLKAANSPGWAAWVFTGGDAMSNAGSWLIAWKANDGACMQSTAVVSTLDCADLSHLTIYAKNGAVVPEPATAALLGLSLIGFGLARRRKIE